MLNTDQIIRIIQESSLLLKADLGGDVIQSLDLNYRQYDGHELAEFKRDLTEAAYKAHLQMLDYSLPIQQFAEFLSEIKQPAILFRRQHEGYIPQLIIPMRGMYQLTSFGEQVSTETSMNLDEVFSNFSVEGEIRFITVMKLNNLISSDDETMDMETPSPGWRLAKLLLSEKRDIFYILFYAIVVGLVSLVLPLGIQTTMELISGGVFFSSVYVLIGGVIVGTLLAGGLQVFQMSLVEFLQRRVFTKAAFEFAYRLPRIRLDALDKQYTPELVNRFFDVITIQKSLPKFLIEFSGASFQILFGLLLLSLYHPFFVFFGMGLLSVLFLIFYLLGPRGLKTSIQESKYKYQVIHWLEDVGRSLHAFKITGSTNLPIRKTDYHVSSYLKNRKSYFRILLTQFGAIVMFKAGIIGGLLIMGTSLVVSREITLGQFVASEVVIILILASVEKIIMYTDVVYDLLTAVDKVGIVTDLPMEKRGGIDMLPVDVKRPFAIRARKLTYRHTDHTSHTLQNIDFDIEAGEKICVAGVSGSGKSTLVNVLAGLLPRYEGSIAINNYSLRDLDLTFYRDHLGGNGTAEDIFDGTWLENITMGNPGVNIGTVLRAIEEVGLQDEVNLLPLGLETKILSHGKGLSSSTIQKILLARCLAKDSRLLLIHDYFSFFNRKEKSIILSKLIGHDDKTVIIVSNDPMVMGACHRVLVLENGKISAQGAFRDLLAQGALDNCIDNS
jgi:ABC-type bacteriocin/lantibiotic exporter with double-glycine peptidase domain